MVGRPVGACEMFEKPAAAGSAARMAHVPLCVLPAGTGVFVRVGVAVGVFVGPTGVFVRVGVLVRVGVAEALPVGVGVAEAPPVGLASGVAVEIGVPVDTEVGVFVGLPDTSSMVSEAETVVPEELGILALTVI